MSMGGGAVNTIRRKDQEKKSDVHIANENTERFGSNGGCRPRLKRLYLSNSLPNHGQVLQTRMRRWTDRPETIRLPIEH